MRSQLSPGDIIRHVPAPRPSLGLLRVQSVEAGYVFARHLETGAAFELEFAEVERDEGNESV